ncbi:MAG: sugar ABC transporter permease [Armatimonadetes bacterium]|nr:sugar ABC transporter permease [Anaerolineae bacterium]
MPSQLRQEQSHTKVGNNPARLYQRALRWLITPYLIGVLLLVIIPAALSFFLAFNDYDALAAPSWVGLKNFKDLLTIDEIFPIAIRNSLLYAALSVPMRVLGALALALLFQQRRRGVGVYRIAVYLPTVIPDVAYALVWLWIFNPIYGPLNQLLAVVGIQGPAWLVKGDSALLAIVIMSVFQLGEGFVVLLAGLNDIPGDYYEAAKVDGGGGWATFRYITFPLIRPWLMLLTLRDITLSVQNSFTPAYLMTGGGPYYATTFLPLMMYEEAFDRFRFGVGSAIMVFVVLGILVILFLVYRLLRGWGYSDGF